MVVSIFFPSTIYLPGFGSYNLSDQCAFQLLISYLIIYWTSYTRFHRDSFSLFLSPSLFRYLFPSVSFPRHRLLPQLVPGILRFHKTSLFVACFFFLSSYVFVPSVLTTHHGLRVRWNFPRRAAHPSFHDSFTHRYPSVSSCRRHLSPPIPLHPYCQYNPRAIQRNLVSLRRLFPTLASSQLSTPRLLNSAKTLPCSTPSLLLLWHLFPSPSPGEHNSGTSPSWFSFLVLFPLRARRLTSKTIHPPYLLSPGSYLVSSLASSFTQRPRGQIVTLRWLKVIIFSDFSSRA